MVYDRWDCSGSIMSIEFSNLTMTGNMVLGPVLFIPPGQIEYTTPGSYTFTVPADVTAISFVVIGAGASGSFTTSASGNGSGGGGGALAYRTVSVTPGQTIYANVGSALETQNAYDAPVYSSGAHGNSNVRVGGEITTATGGNPATIAGGYPAGTYDGGGHGGPGGSKYDAVNGILGGGGGAGGYGANGGGGGAWGGDFAANTAGSLGGGTGGNYYYGYYNAYIASGGGGGANIFGPSIPGEAGGPIGTPVQARLGEGGNYGGGGGVLRYPQYTGGGSPPGFAGKNGAVRIIWGTNRFYPNTNVQDIIF